MDSCALSKRDLNAAELDTVRVSQRPTTIVTANGSLETNEEATVNVKDLHLFVTVQLLDDTPPVVSLGQLCEDHGYSCEWIAGQNLYLVKEKFFAELITMVYLWCLVSRVQFDIAIDRTPITGFSTRKLVA